MTSVTATQLTRLINQTRPHQSTEDDLPIICGIHLDTDGHHLHAIATDRYTIAVARAPLTDTHTNTWAHTLPGPAAEALHHWLDNLNYEDHVTITPNTEGDTTTLTFASGPVSLTAATAPGTFPKWRRMVGKYLNAGPAGTATAINTEFAARWAAADTFLRTWHTGETNPVVFVGDEFIGLQMPVRRTDDCHDHATIAKTWQSTLGDADHDSGTPEPDTAELGTPSKTTAEFTERLLRIANLAARDLARHDISDPRFYTAVDSIGAAWTAHRLLEALRQVSPTTADKILRELDDELTSAAAAEIVGDIAQEAGYDPDKWVADHDAAMERIKALGTAKQPEDAAPAAE